MERKLRVKMGKESDLREEQFFLVYWVLEKKKILFFVLNDYWVLERKKKSEFFFLK